MVGLILLLEARAESARTDAGLLVEAELRVNHLHATVLEHIARGPFPDQASGLDDLATQRTEATAAMAALDVGEAAEDFDEFVTAVSHVMALRHAGSSQAAVTAGVRQLVPSFDAVREDLDAQRVRSEARAGTAEAIRDTGSVLTLILGGLVMILLFRRAEQSRRRAVVRDGEETVLRESERRFESLMSESPDLVTVLDREGMVTFQSSGITQMLGWKVEDVVGHDIREILSISDGANLAAVLGQAEIRVDTRRTITLQMRRSDGQMLSVEAVIAGRFDDPDIRGCLLNIRDQTERIDLEEALRHQAFHDSLTGLPNRALFEDRLAHAFGRSARGGNPLCLLSVDLDDFKDVNDTYGHTLGDAVLVEVAARLVRGVRTEDTVARLGGDEFAVLIDELDDGQDGTVAAQRVIDVLAQPIVIGDAEVFAHASIGVALGSASVGESTTRQMVAQLLIDADLAMYEAKREGRRGYQFYTSSMQEGIKERLSMRSDLDGGLGRGEFVVHYQPIVAIATGAVEGAEALIRWNHPTRGLVPPLDFIPVAERTGQIVDIGRWVIAEACREAATWSPRDGGRPAPYVSVNIAGSQLQLPGFVQEVRDVLADTGLSPDRLVIEVTESALIEDSVGNVLKLEDLRDVGIRLAIDDFGTGYSSLSYLRQFNLDILKIDKSFIDAMEHDPKGASLVAAMVAMGSSLDMEVVAEGIEDLEQLIRLRALRCDLGQGYLFAKPLTAEALSVLLDDGRALAETMPSPRTALPITAGKAKA